MNVYDSARMADVLAPLGFVMTETPDDADMIILNKGTSDVSVLLGKR